MDKSVVQGLHLLQERLRYPHMEKDWEKNDLEGPPVAGDLSGGATWSLLSRTTADLRHKGACRQWGCAVRALRLPKDARFKMTLLEAHSHRLSPMMRNRAALPIGKG